MSDCTGLFKLPKQSKKMKKYVKNVWMYHLIADGPALIFIWFWVEAGTPGSISFILFAFIYPFLYRPVVDYYRLLALEAIEKKDFPKMWKWAGFYRFKWYSKLMFGV